VTKRKKKVLLLQVLIFISAACLLYFTYYNKNSSNNAAQTKPLLIKEKEEKKGSSSFENIEYKGVDLNGNRYVIRSEEAEFEIKKPELINMNIMAAIFYFKDGTILEVKGDYGTYNNKTNDMTFKNNIEAKYEEIILFADNLDYLNSKSSLTIYGNVITESKKGDIVADNLKFDLITKTLDISMFDNEQVDVKLRNK
jgi:LPS export ABC transporter protein LptC